MEAIVYDEHPALLPADRRGSHPADYPYGAPPALHFPQPNAQSDPLADFVESVAVGFRSMADALGRPPDYVVPKRFGMSAILGVMTALAALFGILRFFGAEPYFYAFFAIETLTICLAQMFYGGAPRVASVVAGAVILPLFTFVAAQFSEQLSGGDVCCMLVGFVPFGALLGYITGTCAAGIFLVMDSVENYLKGQRESLEPIRPSRPAA